MNNKKGRDLDTALHNTSLKLLENPFNIFSEHIGINLTFR